MAITLTTPISVVNNIANLTKWAVVDYQNYQAATVPYVSLLVRVSGGGGKSLWALPSQCHRCSKQPVSHAKSNLCFNERSVDGWLSTTDDGLYYHHQRPRYRHGKQQGQVGGC